MYQKINHYYRFFNIIACECLYFTLKMLKNRRFHSFSSPKSISQCKRTSPNFDNILSMLAEQALACKKLFNFTKDIA